MQLDRRFGRSKRCPRKHREAEIDRGRIERVDRLGQLQIKQFVRIQASRLSDQAMGKFGVDTPVARLVGIGQRRTADRLSKAHVVKLCHLGRQTSLDVAQTLSIGDLRECHAAKLLCARKRSHAVVASVAGDDALKRGPRQKIHDLRKQGPANVHLFSPGASSRDLRQTPARSSSNRHHRFHQLTLTPTASYDNDKAS